MLADYHMHFEYGSYDEEWVKGFFESAYEKGVTELGITEHSHGFKEFKDLYYDELILDNSEIGEFQKKWLGNTKSKFVHTLNEYRDFINSLKQKGYPVKFGIEVCNFRNQERVSEILSKYDFDYIIVSIHFIKGWGFDFSALKDIFEKQSVYGIWEDYVREIENVAQSGLYDILGHPFNLRLFNNFPEKNVDGLLEKAAAVLKKNNMAIDINTGTYYRYPINEISPYEDFMKLVKKYDIPVILSSDAHEPGHAGFMIKEAAEYALSFGIDKFLRFDKRKRISEMICLKNK